MIKVMAFGFYIVSLVAYVALTKDLGFLAIIAGLFLTVTAITYLTLIFINRGQRSRYGREGSAMKFRRKVLDKLLLLLTAFILGSAGIVAFSPELVVSSHTTANWMQLIGFLTCLIFYLFVVVRCSRNWLHFFNTVDGAAERYLEEGRKR